jgi:hypothetical protein
MFEPSDPSGSCHEVLQEVCFMVSSLFSLDGSNAISQPKISAAQVKDFTGNPFSVVIRMCRGIGNRDVNSARTRDRMMRRVGR